jgi:2-polyprenyl-3-methyl-5-hydroxy-6-metoxy-1,4-benzoquinol methylase
LLHHLKKAVVVDVSGLVYDPIQQAWSIGRDVGVNDMIAARKVA